MKIGKNIANTKKELKPAIVFDTITTPFNGEFKTRTAYSGIGAVYGNYQPVSFNDTIATTNTIGHTFKHRVEFLMTNTISNIANRICNYTEASFDHRMGFGYAFSNIKNAIEEQFCDMFSNIEEYGPNGILDVDTIKHVIVSISVTIYNRTHKLFTMENSNVDQDDYEFLDELNGCIVFEFLNMFNTIMNEIETIYKPQILIVSECAAKEEEEYLDDQRIVTSFLNK